jgi:CheY-like chemotaxis protein
MKPALLIVEDEPDMRAALCDLLAEERCRVLSAADGAAGLRLIEREVPALVVTDLRMAVMNGWDFVDEILARDDLRNLPVLVFSADPRRPASLPGTISTFTKPDDLDRLVAAVHAILAAGRERRRPAHARRRGAASTWGRRRSARRGR